jgi:protein gp37
MGEHTLISWAHATFNPWWGCTEISPACDHCYARSWAKRCGKDHLWSTAERWRTSDRNWKEVLRWDRKAREEGKRIRVFCASMADVFDNAVPVQWRVDLFELIAKTTNIDWMLLTKRIGNAQRMLDEVMGALSHGLQRWGEPVTWPNVWIGSTIANQAEADRDIPKLLATPARLRFLSCEPLLGPLDFSGRFVEHDNLAHHENWLEALDWVIAGGESGSKARPSHPDWFRSLRDQCAAAGVAFFMKQMGGTRDKRDALESIPEDLRLRSWPQ